MAPAATQTGSGSSDSEEQNQCEAACSATLNYGRRWRQYRT
jgi:hypothetical protein